MTELVNLATLGAAVLHNAASATAAGNVLKVSNTNDGAYNTVAVQITGTFSASVAFEGTIDGTNYVALPFRKVSTGAVATTATTTGIYVGSVTGMLQFRANMTWTSGTSITVTAMLVGGTPAESATFAGVGAADLGKAEDAVHADGDTGIMALTVRKDTAAATSGTTGDYQPAITDASGQLWVNAGAVTPGTGATALGKAEDAQHTTGDTGVAVWAVRKDTVATTAADGDYHPFEVDAVGRLYVNPGVSTVLQLVPVVDTSAYSTGETLFTDTQLTGVTLTSGGSATLNSITFLDKDDETAATYDLFFFDRDVTFGAFNTTPGISDADMLFCQGRLNVPAASFFDVGGSKIASVANIGLTMKSNTTDLWVACVVTGTPTYTAATDIVLNFGFINRS